MQRGVWLTYAKLNACLDADSATRARRGIDPPASQQRRLHCCEPARVGGRPSQEQCSALAACSLGLVRSDGGRPWARGIHRRHRQAGYQLGPQREDNMLTVFGWRRYGSVHKTRADGDRSRLAGDTMSKTSQLSGALLVLSPTTEEIAHRLVTCRMPRIKVQCSWAEPLLHEPPSRCPAGRNAQRG